MRASRRNGPSSLELPRVATVDLTRLRICLAATAPAPPELVPKMRALLGCPAVVRYAMTESPSITGTEPDDPPEVLYRTVGNAQAETGIEVVDTRGDVVSPGRDGADPGRGALRHAGLLARRSRPPRRSTIEGWLLSTDLGRLDADGNLVLVGRMSDMYIRGGYNVYPLEVENVLTEHPVIAGAAVVGAQRSVLGEIGVAFVVLEPGAPTLGPIAPRLGNRAPGGLQASRRGPDRRRPAAHLDGQGRQGRPRCVLLGAELRPGTRVPKTSVSSVRANVVASQCRPPLEMVTCSCQPRISAESSPWPGCTGR